MDDDIPVGSLTIEEAARYLGVSVGFLRKLVRRNDISHARYGNRLHFRPVDLNMYIERNLYEVA
jgi:excisionase family DNA binding protein